MRLQLANIQAFSTKADVKKLNATEIKEKFEILLKVLTKVFDSSTAIW